MLLLNRGRLEFQALDWFTLGIFFFGSRLIFHFLVGSFLSCFPLRHPEDKDVILTFLVGIPAPTPLYLNSESQYLHF